MIYNFNEYNKIYENKSNYNNKIDYTYLKDNATVDDIKQLCEEAEENNFYSICIRPSFVATAKAFLDDTNIKICTVIDFPNGNNSTMNKLKESDEAIIDGADEIDVVIDYKKIKKLSISTDDEYNNIYQDVLNDIKNVTRTAHKNGIIFKAIIEIEELNFNQIKLACEICTEAGVDFIKTSTGFSKNKDSFDKKIEKIKYIRKITPEYIKIKASGGIRNQQQINQLLSYVDRIGTSIII